MLLGASVRTKLSFNSCTPRIRDPELKTNQPIPQIMHAPAGNTPSMMQMHARARLRHSVQHVSEYEVQSCLNRPQPQGLQQDPTSTLHKLALRHWLRMEQKGAGVLCFIRVSRWRVAFLMVRNRIDSHEMYVCVSLCVCVCVCVCVCAY